MKGFVVCPHCRKEISINMEVDLRIRGTQFELNDVSLAVQKAKLLKDRIRGDIASMMEKRFKMDKNHVLKLLKERYELNSESSKIIIEELGIK